MKRIIFFKFTLLCFSIIFLRQSFAQNCTQLSLPEGAIARICPGGNIKALAYSPDGRTLASSISRNWSQEIQLWDVAARKLTLTLSGGGSSIVYSPDGRTLSSGGSLWNTETGEHKLTLDEHSGYDVSIVYSPDGTELAGGGPKGVRLWDAETGQHKLTLDNPVPGIQAVAYSPNGTEIAVASNIGIWIYNLRLGTEVALLTEDNSKIKSVTYSLDSSILVGGGDWGDGTIRLWDAKSKKHKQTLFHEHSAISSVVYSPDGSILASSGSLYNEKIDFWDAKTGQHKQTLGKHKNGVHTITFSPDGNMLASGGADETILLWDLTSFANTNATVSILPSPMPSPALGSQLTFFLKIAAGRTVRGYQATVQFDPSALRYISSVNGDYLSEGGFVVPAIATENTVTLAATSLGGERNGDGTLATLTFEVVAVKASMLKLSEVLLTGSTGKSSRPQVQNGQITEPPRLEGDVNGDDVVNIQDLVLVASNFGKTGENTSDVNSDGVVNIVDMTLVAAAIGNAAGAPNICSRDLEVALTIAEIQQWLREARQVNLTNSDFQRGVLMLEQLLIALPRKEMALLPNYPNPFNPETWIPYQLAKSTDVSVLIYSVDGKLVRTLKLGQQAAGVYQDRSRAAYWNGKNDVGESVASGVYFYTLKAGDFAATRKMLIRK